ncbi:MAG TPA: hypothetical protein VFU47_02905 [Armatimonadota bacterium]|nr:hypothetical protein [Armatimonadota bacterium]
MMTRLLAAFTLGAAMLLVIGSGTHPKASLPGSSRQVSRTKPPDDPKPPTRPKRLVVATAFRPIAG